jgi:hypothetical protein
MTFSVGKDGVVHGKDLGPETPTRVEGITLYDPDGTWKAEAASPRP